jgi:hypothetical protein
MGKKRAVPTSFRLSDEARRLLGEIARMQGIGVTQVLEWVIREKARELGIPLRGYENGDQAET